MNLFKMVKFFVFYCALVKVEGNSVSWAKKFLGHVKPLFRLLRNDSIENE